MRRRFILSATFLLAAGLLLSAVFFARSHIDRAGATDFGIGNVVGVVSWNGSPVTGLLANPAFSMRVVRLGQPGDQGVGVSGVDGSYSLPNLPVGSHSLWVENGNCCYGSPQPPYGVSSAIPVNVLAGQTVTQDIDLTATAGAVVGVITVNGQPFRANFRTSVSGYYAYSGTDSGGNFAWLLPPGSYTVEVLNPSNNALIGTFSFSILAGQTTDVDLGTTPAGNDVVVSVGGGLGVVGGMQLTFSSVTSGGQTTVVESGAGPPPDTGFRIVGLNGQPRYWDVNTTAGYAGPITVCIAYDETQVNGPEDKLTLKHDDGSGYQDVTDSGYPDTVNNIICGTAFSLSPFAVMEPLDGDEDGVDIPIDNCPTVQNSGQENNVHPGTPAGDHCEDPDVDAVIDATDNCPDDWNASQLNTDADALGDACDTDDDDDGVLDAPDNCPTSPNPSQANGDSDTWGDTCDGCPSTATVWAVPPDDDPDCDGFPRSTQQGARGPESFIGTDPDLACGVNAWPVDNNNDNKANLADILAYIPVFGSTPPGPAYNPRFDLNADNAIGLSDILMFIPFFGMTCTP